MFLQDRKAAAASGFLVTTLHVSGLPCLFPVCGLKTQDNTHQRCLSHSTARQHFSDQTWFCLYWQSKRFISKAV